ncbi:MAG: GxxExxY protein [Vicinamibacterales bacterium]|nr:GxxExxY protein [Vicinamibacterales bacterium]
MLRIRSELDDATETLVASIIDCGVAVHRALGPGFLESVYRNALCLEFKERAISFETEKTVTVRYRETPVGFHRMDLVVGGVVVLELKAARSLEIAHQAQLLSYLKATGCRVGLLMNCGGNTLAQGLRRIVL